LYKNADNNPTKEAPEEHGLSLNANESTAKMGDSRDESILKDDPGYIPPDQKDIIFRISPKNFCIINSLIDSRFATSWNYPRKRRKCGS